MSREHHNNCCSCSLTGEHTHQDDSPEMGIEYSLYTRIDKENLTCLNEREDGSAKWIFKPWEERLTIDEKVLESDVDGELLINVPFTGNVKLKGIIIVAPDNDSHPSRMRLFKNQPNMTFDDVGAAEGLQEYELHKDPSGLLEYPTKPVLFSSVSHLTLHFPRNFGHSDDTVISYIGLRGEWTNTQRKEITIANYELRPNLADHPNRIWEKGGSEVS